MPTSLPSPDRRTPAGLVPALEDTGRALQAVSDMERALGALRDFTRRDILLRFYSDPRPRSVDDVARTAGIHRSVAFDHLERLVALGYLEVERRRGFPGKPAKIYRLAAGPVQISHPMRRYDLLAGSLASALDVEAIIEAGRTFGRGLARPGVGSLLAAIEPMSELGAEYDIERSGRIVCNNCLFAEVCRRVPTICNFHAGVIEGLTGLTGSVRALGFHGPGGCAYMPAGV
jgi:predicted ArsR family transcriptional regulator